MDSQKIHPPEAPMPKDCLKTSKAHKIPEVLKLQNFVLLPSQRLGDVLRDGDELTAVPALSVPQTAARTEAVRWMICFFECVETHVLKGYYLQKIQELSLDAFLFLGGCLLVVSSGFMTYLGGRVVGVVVLLCFVYVTHMCSATVGVSCFVALLLCVSFV